MISPPSESPQPANPLALSGALSASPPTATALRRTARSRAAAAKHKLLGRARLVLSPQKIVALTLHSIRLGALALLLNVILIKQINVKKAC
jgi:hypothetical protein